jgi:DNA-binding NarL/FixJ family response regulator
MSYRVREQRFVAEGGFGTVSDRLAAARGISGAPMAHAAPDARPERGPGPDRGPGPEPRPAPDDRPPVNLSAEPIRVLIADDHALFRRGLEMVLQDEIGIEMVGQASDGAEAVSIAAATLPDVVLMDIRMPKTSGIEACRAMKEVAPSAKIVMLTISDEEADLFEAIRAGASGYLLKDIPLDEVAAAVRAVYGGQSLINPSMAGKLLTEFATLARRDETEERVQPIQAPKLTEREMEVLRLVARGLNNRDIAKELFISENTVKNHVRNILEKLQIHSRMEAVMIAVREKLIEFG